MNRILIIVFLLVASLYSVGQDYDLYLQEAFKHLGKGNKENAEKCYEVYKKMTNKTDGHFESLLLKFKAKDEWQKSCYIIKLNDSTDIAVQKLPETQKAVPHTVAMYNATASRLGGFLDWRLPTNQEMHIIIPTLSDDELYFEYYHCTFPVIIVIQNILTDNTNSIHVDVCENCVTKPTRPKTKYNGIVVRQKLTNYTSPITNYAADFVVNRNNVFSKIYGKCLYENGTYQEEGNKNFLANYFIVRRLKKE